jgi:ABC-2 type transport system permease protein
MSTPDANVSAAAAAHLPASTVAQRSMLQTMIVLIRREFWEHRSLWIAPAIVGVLLVLTALPIGHVHFGIDPEEYSDVDRRLGVFTLLVWGQALPQYLVMAIVVSFYLLDCLYSERKDRSILFWKSLPVSDASTVLSKLLVGLVVVPLGVFALAMVTSILFQMIWAVRSAAGSVPPIAVAWDTVAWLKVQGLMLYGLVISILWYSPLAAFLLLISAWARKNVFLWATLPPIILIIAEKWAFGTRYFVGLMRYRTWGIWEALLVPGVTAKRFDHPHVVSLADLFDNITMGKAFLNIDLWLGVAVTVALVFAATRIRRYRDDT